MRNSEVSRILGVIAVYEGMMNEPFKSRAYERAARTVETMGEEVSDLYKRGGREALMEVPGIGEAIAGNIEDLLKTGKTEHLEKLKKKIPVDVESLMDLEGVGPKTIKALWETLKIKNVADLERAARSGKIRNIPRFGEKSEADIIRSIEFSRRHKGRFVLREVLPMIEGIRSRLQNVKGVKKAVIAGSARRGKETIGDADFLVVTDDVKSVMDFFESMPEVQHVYSRGKAKVLVGLKNGMDADLQVIQGRSFGAALQYFTGSKAHNIEMRRIAISKGLKLNEYGVFKGDRQVAGETEEGVYEALGLKWVPPEMREMAGTEETSEKSFSEKVWSIVAKVPRGRVTTYKMIAERLGTRSYRAVGNACNKNHSIPDVPCHRVVESDGSIGGYALGVNRKIKILESEGVHVKNGKVQDFESVLFVP